MGENGRVCDGRMVKVKEMGDRISIQFKDKYGDLSPYLYSHWGGMSLVRAAQEFVNTSISNDEYAGDTLVIFIRSPISKEFDDLHIEFDDFGDNGDNGNIIIAIETGKAERTAKTIPKKDPTQDEILQARDFARNHITATIQTLDLAKNDLKRSLEKFDNYV
jgi:hypothetical protein